MKYTFLSTLPLLILSFTLTGAQAQTLDTADNASMAASMDAAAQAFEKMKAQYEAAPNSDYKRWAESRHFNISYKVPPKAAAAGKGAAGSQPAAPQQQAKTPSYTYIFQTKNSTNPCGGLVFALRRDMSDLGLSECPTPFDSGSVKGALFSYGGDAVKHNNTWTAQALGALNYSWEGFDPNNHFFQPIYFSTGIYGSTNTILNSAKSFTKNNTEVYTYGLVGSLGIAPPNRGLYQNFNFSVGGVSNDVTNTTAYNETIRYTPAWGDLLLAKPIPINPLPLSLRFEASLIGQFDQAGEHNKANRLAFNNQFDSVRIGPQLALNLIPNTSEDTPYAYLKGLSASVIYHWAYETIGDKALPLFTVNVNYTLDEAKHFALAATYQRGYDENTGIYMNQYLIGLAAKY